MKKESKKKPEKTSSKPEKVSAEESLERMKTFSKRKEKIVAFIVESQN